MWQNFEKIDYNSLNAKQKENFNFQKVAAAFADYGFNCIQLMMIGMVQIFWQTTWTVSPYSAFSLKVDLPLQLNT
jgi:hypothetical protein